jgi:hypothetical protein
MEPVVPLVERPRPTAPRTLEIEECPGGGFLFGARVLRHTVEKGIIS